MRVPHPHFAGPVYQLLPYAYGALGLGALVLSYYLPTGWFSTLLFAAGFVLIVWALMIGLRRREFRSLRNEYDDRSL
jgi:hypothetical protein